MSISGFARHGSSQHVLLRAAGLALVSAYVAVVVVVSRGSSYNLAGGLVVGPLLVLITLPVIARQARREADQTVFWILLGALLLRDAGTLARQFTASVIYDGAADAPEFLAFGAKLAGRFWQGNFATGLPNLTSTNFIRFFTGVVYSVTGPTDLGVYLAFAWMGFMGLFLAYRAFTIAVPEGASRSYLKLLFFLPSLVFWPSSVGKDAWMLLAIGIVMFGAAILLSGRSWWGLAALTPGLWMAWVVRPHVAGMLGLAVAASLAFRRPHRALGTMAPIFKGVTLVACLAVGWVLVSQANDFLTGAVQTSGTSSTIAEVTQRTAIGGSAFNPTVVRTPLEIPIATITVLFRPLPIEANNALSLGISLEGSFLLALALVRHRWIWAALRSIRRQPFVTVPVLYCFMFVVAFSAIANFGILARQRVQVLPLFLVLLCIPPPSLSSLDNSVPAA